VRNRNVEREESQQRKRRRKFEKQRKEQRKLERRSSQLERDRRRLERQEDRLERRRHARRGRPNAATGRGRRQAGRTPEQRAYLEARQRANLKMGFATHFITYASVLALILVASRSLRATLIVAMAWGIGIAVHYFAAIIAPDLRKRWVEREVGRGVEQGVTQTRKVAETRRNESMEKLSASIAHEIRNPITAAKSLVQQMGEDPVAPENIEYAEVALGELDRVERSISHLLKYARDEEMHSEDFLLSDVIDSALETFRDSIVSRGIRIEREADSAGAMRGDIEKIRRVVINLVANAVDALEQSNTHDPRIELVTGENLAGTNVWLRVADNGPGMEPAMLDEIFSPFYTTKEAGTGLGLAISKKIVEAHDGTMEAQSDLGRGTEFVLTFPKDRGMSRRTV